MLGRKRTSKKAARKSFAETKMAKGLARVGREISYVGLGVASGVATTAATSAAGSMIADAGQKAFDAVNGGATVTVREKGLFKKTKEIKMDEMKKLKKYKDIQYHGLHDPKTLASVTKGIHCAATGVGAITGGTTYCIIRDAIEGERRDRESNVRDMTDEELYEE